MIHLHFYRMRANKSRSWCDSSSNYGHAILILKVKLTNTVKLTFLTLFFGTIVIYTKNAETPPPPPILVRKTPLAAAHVPGRAFGGILNKVQHIKSYFICRGYSKC
jgi:hypothetical protein